MNRRVLLISACCFAAVSLGLNVWLMVQRHRRPESPPPVAAPAAEAGPALQPVQMDFSGTAFADGAWKLENPRPGVSLDKPVKLELAPAPAESPDTSPGAK